ncbi:ferredoxin family protein [Amycolatopsis sp. GM8]|uniref:4Fe-4S dicluster domain-containing protein n=1 Tax=Amycolatopsis sp. GM8 TaxID=2896530 RepID=UPI001F220181|nr:ferredoxin family protein [Amycolatopsis sp. GM8]
MIELVSAQRCVSCDKCVRVCPTDVFESGPGGIPVIARQSDCQTCFLCEAYCPVDALYVAPQTHPLPEPADERRLAADGLLGSYRAALGWGHGRTPGAALVPPIPLRHETGGKS